MRHLYIAGALGLEGYYSFGQVLIDKFDSVDLIERKIRMNISPRTEREIEKKWRDHLLTHPEDFDGDLGSVIEMYEYPRGTLKVKFHKGKFSQFYGTYENRKEKLDLKQDVLDREICLPVSIGAVMRTPSTSEYPNGCIVFAKRGKTAFDEKTITLLPGGYFDPTKDFFFKERSNRLVKEYSITTTLLRELFEETEILLNTVKINYLGVVYNSQGSRQPLIACYIDVPFSEKLITDEESEKIFLVKNDIKSVRDFLKGKKLAVHDAWKLILYFNKMLKD
ncbi:MAG: hypothetical protein MCSN_0960 [Candidatus Microsyncoccus archaeolyticus]|nr:MAG: hypothetical protein MCSN_0960 [Candidatus Parcubacteria bacterium]